MVSKIEKNIIQEPEKSETEDEVRTSQFPRLDGADDDPENIGRSTGFPTRDEFLLTAEEI